MKFSPGFVAGHGQVVLAADDFEGAYSSGGPSGWAKQTTEQAAESISNPISGSKNWFFYAPTTGKGEARAVGYTKSFDLTGATQFSIYFCRTSGAYNGEIQVNAAAPTLVSDVDTGLTGPTETGSTWHKLTFSNALTGSKVFRLNNPVVVGITCSYDLLQILG